MSAVENHQLVADTLSTFIRQIGRRSDVAIQPASRLVEDLGVNSLRLVDLLLRVEGHFNITIPNSEAASVLTFGDLLSVVERVRG